MAEVLPSPSNGSDQAREERMVGRAVLWALDKSKKNWKMFVLGLMILSGHPYARTLAESMGFKLPWSEPPKRVVAEASPRESDEWKRGVDRRLNSLEKNSRTIIKLLTDDPK